MYNLLPMYRIKRFCHCHCCFNHCFYIIAEKFAPKKKTVIYRNVPMTKTGDADADALIVQEPDTSLNSNEANEKIVNEDLSNKIVEIEDTAVKILKSFASPPNNHSCENL